MFKSYNSNDFRCNKQNIYFIQTEIVSCHQRSIKDGLDIVFNSTFKDLNQAINKRYESVNV